jgi:hypothetical protein
MRFHKRIEENLHVFGDKLDDGTWRITVVDAVSRPVKSVKLRARALREALVDQSSLRTALWDALPPEEQKQLLQRKNS